METYTRDRSSKIVVVGILLVGPMLVAEAIAGFPTSLAFFAIGIAGAFVASGAIYFIFLDEKSLVSRFFEPKDVVLPNEPISVRPSSSDGHASFSET